MPLAKKNASFCCLFVTKKLLWPKKDEVTVDSRFTRKKISSAATEKFIRRVHSMMGCHVLTFFASTCAINLTGGPAFFFLLLNLSSSAFSSSSHFKTGLKQHHLVQWRTYSSKITAPKGQWRIGLKWLLAIDEGPGSIPRGTIVFSSVQSGRMDTDNLRDTVVT